MPDPAHKAADSEVEIWNAIAAFEKILEALPTDRVSLETLADAYEKVGDHTRAKDYVLRLARVLIDEADEDAARDLLRKIREYDTADPNVKAVIALIEHLQSEKVMADVLDTEGPGRRTPNIANEIAFAWNLLQANKLSQEDYSRVVHDLSENSTKTSDIPVSTLHVLHDMNFPALNDILGFVATTCNTPVISLANFEFQPSVTNLAPLDFIVTRGVLPFEVMGNDLLVALLNPYDPQLLDDLNTLTGKTCHAYLVSAAEFDTLLDRLRKANAAA